MIPRFGDDLLTELSRRTPLDASKRPRIVSTFKGASLSIPLLLSIIHAPLAQIPKPPTPQRTLTMLSVLRKSARLVELSMISTARSVTSALPGDQSVCSPPQSHNLHQAYLLQLNILLAVSLP